jgi:uncharacterized MAPEG superfamily protein
MRPELILLGCTLILALVQIGLAGQAKTIQYGAKWNAGPRDEEQPPLNPIAGRLQRAQANLFETLPLFVGAVLAAAVADRLGAKTLLGAHLYFWGRVVYVPLYAAGIPVVRSLVWLVSGAGLLLVIAGLLFG